MATKKQRSSDTTDIVVAEVGGHVRDTIMGLASKDKDYVVVAPSYQAMKEYLEDEGYRIYREEPEFFTIRAKHPNGDDADFVWARREGRYSDGRHPDWVEPATLEEDLARRDFTMNAIARLEDGTFVDPFNGWNDISNRKIICVGNAEDRMSEDPLRMLRALRFSITKGMVIGNAIDAILWEYEHITLRGVSAERIRDELYKMFAHDTLLTLMYTTKYKKMFQDIFSNYSIWLEPTMKKGKKK